MKRPAQNQYISRVVNVGSLAVGGNHPVRIQSMTNAPALDVKATIDQCMRCFDAEADCMRISVPDKAAVECLSQVKKGLLAAGYDQPLIADIHFKPDLALAAARLVEKVRINPGNYNISHNHKKSGKLRVDKEMEYDTLQKNLTPLLKVCKEYGTAIRIGTNAGSLAASVMEAFGHGPEALVESSLLYLRIFNEAGFSDTIVSLKASDPFTTLVANKLMAMRMAEEKMPYPLHIGVTEAGSGNDGKLRSALGVLPLLQLGLGDTIRISLTAPPEEEVHFARNIMATVDGKNCQTDEDSLLVQLCDAFAWPVFSLHPASSKNQGFQDAIPADTKVFNSLESLREEMVRTALNKGIQTREHAEQLAGQLLQSGGLLATDTEFISCPTCARTTVDLVRLNERVKAELSGYPGIKVAVMGCIVNGPGEMAGADFGIMGTSLGKLHVYRGRKPVFRNLHTDEAIQALKSLISEKSAPR